MFVAKINDDCLLGADFLCRINLENIFDREFNETGLNEKGIYNCFQIVDSPKVPFILKESNYVNLEITQREIFANFLNNFRDVIKHVINVKDSLSIKQVPR